MASTPMHKARKSLAATAACEAFASRRRNAVAQALQFTIAPAGMPPDFAVNRSLRNAPKLPPPGIAPRMHAGNNHNPIALYVKEKGVREASHPCATDFQMDNLKGEGATQDDLHCLIHSQSKTQAKVRMNTFVPGKRLFQVCICFRQPNKRQCHRFLKRPALTCSQETTSSGLRSYCPMR